MDFNADEAIWGWARQEITAHLFPHRGLAAQAQVGGFFADLAHRRGEVTRRCLTILQARAAELAGSARADLPGQANVDFTLASV